MKYLESGSNFGFPLRKIIPDELREKCVNQEWYGLEIKSGLKEGQGIFANKLIKINMPHCAIMVEFKCHELMQRDIFFPTKRSVIT